MSNPHFPTAAILALALAACAEPEETTYETDVEDLGGGELIVNDADPEGVEVDLPETPMTPVPEGAETDGIEPGETAPPIMEGDETGEAEPEE